MNSKKKPLFVLIESGATAMKGIVISGTGRIIVREIESGVNPVECGWTKVSNHIGTITAKLVKRAAQAMNVSVMPEPAAVALALAGAGDKAGVDRALRIAGSLFGGCPAVAMSDAEAALLGVSPEGRGVITISGTGSMSMASSGDNTVFRAGGWGAVTGDPGSGWWIGRQGLKHVLNVEDGLENPGKLAEVISCKIGLSGRELAIWGSRASRREIGTLAISVLENEKADSAAAEIVNQALKNLCNMTLAVADRVNWEKQPYNVCATGGVFDNWPDFQTRFFRRLRRKMKLMKPVRISSPALLGLARAAAFASHIEPPRQLTC